MTPLARICAFGLLAVLVLTGGLAAQGPQADYTPVTEAQLLDPPDGEWLMWRRTYDHWGYSPLDQIDRSNVGGLELAWMRDMEPGLQETTPLIHDGVMFLTQACDYVEAVDARDGTRLWEYRRERVDHPATLACANRNAVLYGNRIFIATHDAYLVALDARSGEVDWERRIGEWTLGQHYSGGPQLINGRIVAGMSGCYYINSPCWVSAHDPDTGEEIWRTYTLARNGDPGEDSWGDLPDDERHGGSAWIAPGYDPELGLIYVGVAVPIPWGAIQRNTGDGDALYTDSTVALDAETGEIRWYFQHLPSDEWDLDHAFERILVETEVAPDPDAVEWINPALRPGDRRKVVTGIPGKTGVVWTLDATTGDFLWARSTNYQNVIVGVDAENRKGIVNAELRPQAIREPVTVCPHLMGGINWQAVAYSPDTNAIYTPTNNTCMTYSLLAPPELNPGVYHASAVSRRIPVPDSDGQVGLLTAVDVATGRTLWERRQRAGIAGSALTTGGGLLLLVDDEGLFRAFDARTGDVLWEQALGSGAGGFPVTYSVDDVQYVAIPAGGGRNYLSITPEIEAPSGGNRLFVFRLP